MNFDKNQIRQSIDDVAKKWDYSGHVLLSKNGDMLHNEYYGYENREDKVETTEDTRYLLDANHNFFVRFAILMEISRKNMEFSDTISKYIPELKHGDKIKLKYLMNNKSGLIDYYHSHLMVQFETDETLKALSTEERVRKESSIRFEQRDFETVLGIMNEQDLDYEPGLKEEWSNTDAVMLAEILRRVTEKTPYEYLKENVFDVLGMSSVTYGTDVKTLSYVEHNRDTLISTPVDFEAEGVFSVKAEDVKKLMIAVLDKEFLSDKVWKQALKSNKEGTNILFESVNGYECMTIEFMGFELSMYFDFDKRTYIALLDNQQQLFENVDDNWLYYKKDYREAITALLTFPENTKMVKLDKKNFWGTLGLSIREDQKNYVLNAKSSVAMGCFYKHSKVFVQMEGDVIVGLLVLYIDKKKEKYEIEIIIIDQKFQNKGYGKLMVKWAVDYLKKAGATRLNIGVARENAPAKKVYLNAGFKPKSVYDGGMELEIRL